MSLRAMLAICLAVIASQQALADNAAYTSKSYTTTVQSQSVFVRSGPGENYYATEVLRAGDKVRVLRQGPRGWLAILPTRESFNWISARYVREVQDGMLEVTGDRVALRVGSDLTSSREAYQSTASRGDQLEMIDRVSSPSGDWYRVSPPKGEVRWISGAHLEQPTPPAQQQAMPVAPPLQPALLAPPQLQSARGSDEGYRRLPPVNASSAQLHQRINELERQLHELDRGEIALNRGQTRDRWVSQAAFQEIVVPQGIAPGMPVTGPMMAPGGMAVTDPGWDPYGCGPMTAMDCGCPVQPRWAGFGATGVKAGTDRIIGETDLFIPLWQDDDSLLFADLRGSADDLDNREVNGGVGLRSIVGDNLILGGYGFYDYRWSQTGNEFWQVTAGAELKTYEWDVRGNIYIAEGGTQNAGPAVGANPRPVFANNTILLITGGPMSQQLERAYYGVDFEVGYLLAAWGCNNMFELRGYAGGYYFDTDDSRFPHLAGPRARIDLTAFDLPWLGNGSRLSVGGEYTWDEVRDSQFWGVARVQIPFNIFRSPAPHTPFRRRMLDPVQRDVDIITEISTNPEVTENTRFVDTGQDVGIVTLTDANSDLPTTVAAAGPGSTVIVDGGSGTVKTSTTTFVQNGQTLRGAGVAVQGVQTGEQAIFGTRPTIVNTGGPMVDTVVVTDNAQVRGLTIFGGQIGISSDPMGGGGAPVAITNAAIVGNHVSEAQAGLSFGDINAGTVVANNTANNNSTGIQFGNVNQGGVVTGNSANDNAIGFAFMDINAGGLVTGNTANKNQFLGFAFDDVSGTLSGNSANENSGTGFSFEEINAGGLVTGNTANKNSNGFNSNFNVSGTFSGNTANENTGVGFSFNDINAGGSVSGNTANNNRFVGFSFDNVIAGGSFTGNTANSNGFSVNGVPFGDADGFNFDNNAGTFTGNTANANSNDGFAAGNDMPFNQNAGTFSNNTANNNGDRGFRGNNNGGVVQNNVGANNTGGGNTFP